MRVAVEGLAHRFEGTELDTRTSHSVSHVLGNLAGQGMIVLVATHDPDTRNACDRVIDLADYAPQVGGSTTQLANITVP